MLALSRLGLSYEIGWSSLGLDYSQNALLVNVPQIEGIIRVKTGTGPTAVAWLTRAATSTAASAAKDAARFMTTRDAVADIVCCKLERCPVNRREAVFYATPPSKLDQTVFDV